MRAGWRAVAWGPGLQTLCPERLVPRGMGGRPTVFLSRWGCTDHLPASQCGDSPTERSPSFRPTPTGVGRGRWQAPLCWPRAAACAPTSCGLRDTAGPTTSPPVAGTRPPDQPPRSVGGSPPPAGPRHSLGCRRKVNRWGTEGLRTPREPGAARQQPGPWRPPHHGPAGAEDSPLEPSGLLPPLLARPLEWMDQGLRSGSRTLLPEAPCGSPARPGSHSSLCRLGQAPTNTRCHPASHHGGRRSQEASR